MTHKATMQSIMCTDTLTHTQDLIFDCARSSPSSPPAEEAKGSENTHTFFMSHNGLLTLPAHTSASIEQAGPAPSRLGLKNTNSIWKTLNTQTSEDQAAVTPMNYRNDLTVFSFGNTGSPPTFLTTCGFWQVTWYRATSNICLHSKVVQRVKTESEIKRPLKHGDNTGPKKKSPSFQALG